MKYDPADQTNPGYYNTNHLFRTRPIECIEVIECLNLGFTLGNAFKYIWRLGAKGDINQVKLDLSKAAWYLARWKENENSARVRPSGWVTHSIHLAVGRDIEQMITQFSLPDPNRDIVATVDDYITTFMEGYSGLLERLYE